MDHGYASKTRFAFFSLCSASKLVLAVLDNHPYSHCSVPTTTPTYLKIWSFIGTGFYFFPGQTPVKKSKQNLSLTFDRVESTMPAASGPEAPVDGLMTARKSPGQGEPTPKKKPNIPDETPEKEPKKPGDFCKFVIRN